MTVQCAILAHGKQCTLIETGLSRVQCCPICQFPKSHFHNLSLRFNCQFSR